MCDIEDDVKEALKKSRFRKNDKNTALISLGFNVVKAFQDNEM